MPSWVGRCLSVYETTLLRRFELYGKLSPGRGLRKKGSPRMNACRDHKVLVRSITKEPRKRLRLPSQEASLSTVCLGPAPSIDSMM